jgi:ATP-dependent helicase/nuclease subunit A
MKIPLGEEEKMTGSLAEKNHVERTRLSEIAEHARVLYVALTRAIDSVFMSWTEPADKNSWAEMMHWDFSEGLHVGTKYSYQVQTQKPEPVQWQSFVTTSDSLRKPWSLGVKLAESHSVSVTELLEKDQKSFSGQPSQQKWLEHFKVISHGSLTHKLMQALKYSDVVDALIERWFRGRQDEVLRALEFIKSLKAPPLLKLIQDGYVEMGFSYKNDGKIIDGQIDLWGIVDQVAWIVDYKTGSIKHRDKAFLQLGYYAQALEKSNMIPKNAKIKLTVVYPFAEKIYQQDFTSQESQLSENPRGQ